MLQRCMVYIKREWDLHHENPFHAQIAWQAPSQKRVLIQVILSKSYKLAC